MIWSKEETLPREELEKLQLSRLQETVHRVYEKVPAYRKKMDEVSVKPEDIKTLKDLAKLPFVTKQDMRDNYPFGLFAVEKDKLVRIHASSGTTGKPTVVGYTQGDLDTWTECVSRIACMGGASSSDVAQICFGYGMFTGALGLHYGLENIGAAIVPSSTGNSEKQLMYMKDFGTTLLVATPSYALRLAEVAREMGVDPEKDLKIKIALVGGGGGHQHQRIGVAKLALDVALSQESGEREAVIAKGLGQNGQLERLVAAKAVAVRLKTRNIGVELVGKCRVVAVEVGVLQ